VDDLEACVAKCLNTTGCVGLNFMKLPGSPSSCSLMNSLRNFKTDNPFSTHISCGQKKKDTPCLFKSAVLADKGSAFKPKCDDDGFFENKQCFKEDSMPDVEHCWCTQLNGEIVPGTFVMTNSTTPIPDCARHAAIKPVCKENDALISYPGALNPEDCGRYISCAPQRMFTCTCGPGLYFDFENQICDWAMNVKCGESESELPP